MRKRSALKNSREPGKRSGSPLMVPADLAGSLFAAAETGVVAADDAAIAKFSGVQ